MRVLKIPSWLFKLLKGLVFFLLVWIPYLTLRKRSFNTRLRFGVLIAFLFYYFFYRKGAARIKKNIALIRPDLSKKEIDRGAWRLAKTLARSWAAMLGHELTNLEEVTKKIEVRNAETLLDYYRRKEKIIATAVHVGPVDEMIAVIPLFGVRVYVPAEAVKPEWLFKLMMRLRLRFGDIVFDPVEKGKILSNAPRHLSDGRIVVLVVDMTRKDSGVVCRIGNAKARFSVGAVKLALEQNATIIPVFPSLTKDNKAQVAIGQPFKLIKTGDMRKDIENNTRRLIEEVYAPHILKNLFDWLRLLWSDLEPAEI